MNPSPTPSLARRATSTLPHACAMGVMGASVTWVSNLVGLPTWLVFLVWLAYFVFARAKRDAPKLFLQIATGALAALAIQMVAGALSGAFGGAAFPAAVVMVVATLAMTDLSPRLAPLPAYFLGMVAAFALPLRAEAGSLGVFGAAAAVGIFAAMATSALRGAIYGWQASRPRRVVAER